MPVITKENYLEETNKILDKKKFLETLPISDEYANLFFRMTSARGLQNIKPYEDELIFIARNGCDITKLFLESKLIGISNLYKIVKYANEKKRVGIYIKIRAEGWKANENDIDLMLETKSEPNLFD